jgi:hypothetical protein
MRPLLSAPAMAEQMLGFSATISTRGAIAAAAVQCSGGNSAE